MHSELLLKTFIYIVPMMCELRNQCISIFFEILIHSHVLRFETWLVLNLSFFLIILLGHSTGEIGCAYADGCLTLEETILSAYCRGLASKQTEVIRGAMAAVGMGYDNVTQFLFLYFAK